MTEKKLPPRWLVKTLFIVLLPLMAIGVIVSIVASETRAALRSMYLEFRIEWESLRDIWRRLP